MAVKKDDYVGEPKWVRFVVGGLASCTGEAATIPIDTVKVRMQLQGSADATKMYNNVFDAFVKIVRNEGTGGLYKGLTAGLMRQAFYSSIRMGIYEPIRNAICGNNPDPPYLSKVVAGGTAGAIGAFFANPTDLVKIRMQADRDGTRYKSALGAFASIVREEGFFGMWRGCLPNLQRAFIVNAAELSTYDQAKTMLIKAGVVKDNLMGHFAASLCAGIVGAAASSPVDVAKTRLMNQRQGNMRIYNGMVDCFVKTVKQEGFFALYKGFFPNWMRLGPWCVVMFLSYEQYRRFARRVWDKKTLAEEH